MNDTVQVRHPSLWLFIRHLKDRQPLTEESMAESGDAPPRRRRKCPLLARLKAIEISSHTGALSATVLWKLFKVYLACAVPWHHFDTSFVCR